MVEPVFVGIKFGSLYTVTQVYDKVEGVKDLCQGPILSSICLKQPTEKEEMKIVCVGNETINKNAQPFCVVSELSLLLTEEEYIRQSEYYLPYTFDSTFKDRKITAKWKKKNQITTETLSIDFVLNGFFHFIYSKAKQINDKANVHVVVGVPFYIQKNGKRKLKEILKNVGFSSFKVKDGLKLLSVLLDVDQVQSKTRYTIIFDIGYHHSTLAIRDNDTGYIVFRSNKMIGGSDVICSLMKLCLKPYGKSLENLTFSQIFKLRTQCQNALVSLSMNEETQIDIDDFFSDENLEYTLSQENVNSIIDEYYGNELYNLYFQVLENEQYSGSTVLLIGMVTHIPRIEQIIKKICSSKNLAINEILVRNKSIAYGAVATYPACRQGKERRDNYELREKNKMITEENKELTKENKELTKENKELNEILKARGLHQDSYTPFISEDVVIDTGINIPGRDQRYQNNINKNRGGNVRHISYQTPYYLNNCNTL